MFENKIIAVVVPCYNEGILIGRVIETMPDFVDRIYIVDDCSKDNTVEIIQSYVDKDYKSKINLIRHEINQGVGGAIASGYKAALADNIDVTAVMAGDAQMDPTELEKIIIPVVRGEYDYTKGNRLFSGDAWNIIPRIRYLGNSILSLLTKIASGYWHVADSQSGYTAISLNALKTINWDHMYKRYGQPNDLLVRLNIYSFRVKDIPIRPVYNIGEKSGIKPIRMVPKLSFLLFKLFWFRMFQKYVIRDFHPLLFFYGLGTLLFPTGIIFGLYLIYIRLMGAPVAETSALFAAFLSIMGIQFLLFAMWMDMETNKDLK
ncbi:MAG: glycosyltransferase family 2 protein [Candidatus Heimdallarchaeota archaeon]|nr:glycosyltransferase family 2 protein [Candidatus Heimdallarchaeota archaeon]